MRWCAKLDLGDVKKAFSDIRNFNLPAALEKHVDPDGSIRGTFADNPLHPTYPTPAEVSTLDEVAVSAPPVVEALPPPEPVPAKPLAPAFVPPSMVPAPVIEAAASASDAPAFIPPEVVLQRQSR